MGGPSGSLSYVSASPSYAVMAQNLPWWGVRADLKAKLQLHWARYPSVAGVVGEPGPDG